MPRLSKIGAAALAAFGWTSGAAGVTASYLIVAGGGGGGQNFGNINSRGMGGGGAGGYQAGTTSLNPTLSYAITVGAGGAGGIGAAFPSTGTQPSNGSNSVFNAITSTGGGSGATSNQVSGNGGSGGGGCGDGNASGGTGIAGQGNAGGNSTNAANTGGAGGGGSGAAGTSVGSGVGTGGAGGTGTASSISGSSTTYATGGTGGNSSGAASGSAGSASTGNGGNGAAGFSSGTPPSGGNGGSGVVIISYAGAQQFGGGVVTSVGGNTIHTFTTSGTLSPLSSLTASYLIVAGGGGGGGGMGGGGGAGGLLSGSGLTLDTNSIYTVTVGAGGAAAALSSGAQGVNGSNSAFGLVSTAAVGGGGAGYQNASGVTGGSGGGAGSSSGVTAGSGTAGQGNAGGLGAGLNSGSRGAGGGGGSSAVGGVGTSTTGGNGGAGTASSITGSSVTYAGGGGAGCGRSTGTPGTGGAGGGGSGTNDGSNATNGTANLGGGGGGGGESSGFVQGSGGAGGSGVVIISYPGSTPQMAGGTVTAAGGNIIHTFTSSGYLSPIVNVNNSLRFRGTSVNAYLSRTPTVTGNRQKFTWSGWLKRGKLGTYQEIFGSDCPNPPFGNTMDGIRFNNSDQLEVLARGGNDIYVVPSMLFRDPAAWYHIVVAIDTTQSTASNRVLIYINGVVVTAFNSATYPSQNYNLIGWNVAGYRHTIGIDPANLNAYQLDGYQTEDYFVDGQQLTPNSFGATNGQGVWQPVRYGGSYGTNGFYLPFNAGTQGYAGNFNGSQYLTVANNSAFDFGSGNFTVEFFVCPTSSGEGIFSKRFNSSGEYAPLQLIWSGSTFTAYVSTSGSSWASSITSPSYPINTWYHVAVVRNGTTLTLYVNGNSVGTGTVSGALMTNTAPIAIGSQASDGLYNLVGNLSNFRMVKGTAVYTSNFVPPTSPLTNISGTSILTLQNATIVDNSSNAFTITNNGTATTGTTYPFALNVFKDQGPAGNNWTPNNISGVFGSTLDYMTDVPTNTSATVANYAVLNPLDNTSQNIANGNLQCYGANAWGHRRSTIQMTTGSWYWEVTPSFAGGNYIFTGVVTPSASLSQYVGQNANGWGFDTSNGGIVNNGSTTSYGSAVASGVVIGVAFDAATGKLWFRNASGWFNSGNPATATNPAVTIGAGSFFAAGSGYETNSYNNFNFGQQPFAYTPPSGFVALNTFNLPTPTIGATPATTANKYFDVSLYTGNGYPTSGTQSITNSGSMQPDFIWIKNRDGVGNHTLTDSVRGTNSQLFSNSTAAQETVTDAVTAFNSNGFSLGSNTQGTLPFVNVNTKTFVGWQWRASNTTAVTNTAGSITSSVSANTTAGFSIVTYTGNGTNNATIGHGLGVTPSMVIVKSRTSGIRSWFVAHTSLATNNNLLLQTTDSAYGPSAFGSGVVGGLTSTVFECIPGTVAPNNVANINNSGDNLVAYCFAQVAGYSAFGSFVGNGSTDGTFVYLGFRPKYVMIKASSTTGNWNLVDSVRNPSNVVGELLYADATDAGATYTLVDFLSNGFKLRNSGGNINNSGVTYIYAAFAESPFKYANAR